jgi:cytidylate kinase
MYRAITLTALNAGVDIESGKENGLNEILNTLDMNYVETSNGFELMVNGKFPGQEIRSPKVADYVSVVAAMPNVRHWLLDRQRAFAELGRIVMEGRDIGTVIFPDAEHKFFLTATPEARALRRLSQHGETVDGATLESVARDIAERDRIDSTRATAPLRQAQDAVLIDTTELSIEQVVENILEYVK